MKKRAKVKPAWLVLAQQVGVVVLVTLVLCAIVAALVVGRILPQEMIGAAATVCIGIGTAVGSRMAAMTDPNGKLIRVGIITGITVLLVLLGNLLFVREAPSGWLRVIAAILIGGLLAILTAFGHKKRQGKRR